jgi:hypothetical protein
VYGTSSALATLRLDRGAAPVGTRFIEEHFERGDAGAGPLFMMEKRAAGFSARRLALRGRGRERRGRGRRRDRELRELSWRRAARSSVSRQRRDALSARALQPVISTSATAPTRIAIAPTNVATIAVSVAERFARSARSPWSP